MNITRRSLLKLSVAAMLARGISPGVLRAADAERPKLALAVINDLHYTDEGCAPFFARLVEKVNAAAPDVVLVAGDLVEKGTAAEFAAIKAILAKLKAPLHVVPGNHDYTPVKGGPATRTLYEEAFPNALNYTFELAGWQFVALDTCDGTKFNDVAASKATLDFLDTALPRIDRKRPMVLVTHFPLGEKVSMRLTNADALLARFKEHNLLAAYSGHHHGFTERKLEGGTILTTNRCCSFRRANHDQSTAKGYFEVACVDGTLTRTFVEFGAGK